MSNTSMPDTPLGNSLLAMTAASIQRCDLADREIMVARIAALAAVGAPALSYTLNAAAAAESGLTADDAEGILIVVGAHYRDSPGRCCRRRDNGGARNSDRISRGGRCRRQLKVTAEGKWQPSATTVNVRPGAARGPACRRPPFWTSNQG